MSTEKHLDSSEIDYMQNEYMSSSSVQVDSGSSLTGHFSQKQAKTEVVKIKNSDFSYWA